MKFKGVVYDLDGTLLDTEWYQYMGWVESLKQFGIELSEEDYIRDYAGKTDAVIEEDLIQKYNLPIKNGELLRKKEELLMQWFSTEKLQLMPFVVEAIEYFNQLQLRPAVCSGAPKDEILLKLRRSSLSKYFNPDKVASRDNVKRGKPFPDIYLHAASLIGLEPEQCMAFEDTQYGVQSAKDAGLYCVAIPTKWSRFQDFSRADIVLKDFRETIKYCSRLLYDTL